MPHNRIAVLGRGMSLQIYRDYSHLFKLIYLVNGFDSEIKEVGVGHFSKKKVVHVAARKGPTYLTRKNYKRLNVKRIQSNAFKTNLIVNKNKCPFKPKTMPEIMNNRGYPPIGWKAITEGKQEGKRISPNRRAWPTCGMLAIDLALAENKPKELYLFGFDFYQQPYLAGQKITKKEPAKLQIMKQHLERLVNEFPDTQFKSSGEYVIDAPNWENIGRNEESWETVPVKDLLARQIRHNRFNRMDTVVRYMAIENYYKKNNIGWKIYLKMQKVRLWGNASGARNKKREFCNLIKSVESEGYKNMKPLRVQAGNYHLLNGSHRLACAIYFNVKEVVVWKDFAKKKVAFNIKWFRKNHFKGKYVAAIEKKAKQIALKLGVEVRV